MDRPLAGSQQGELTRIQSSSTSSLQKCNMGCAKQVGNFMDVWQADCKTCKAEDCRCTVKYNFIQYGKSYALLLQTNPIPSDKSSFDCNLPLKPDCEQLWMTNIKTDVNFEFSPTGGDFKPPNDDGDATYLSGADDDSSEHSVFLKFVPLDPKRHLYPVYASDTFHLDLIFKGKTYPLGFRENGGCASLRVNHGRTKFRWLPELTDQMFGVAWVEPYQPIDLNLSVFNGKIWYSKGPWRTKDGELIFTTTAPCPKLGVDYFGILRLVDVSPLMKPPVPEPKLCNLEIHESLITPPCPEGYQCVLNWCMKHPSQALLKAEGWGPLGPHQVVHGDSKHVSPTFAQHSSSKVSMGTGAIISLVLLLLLVGVALYRVLKE